ncbi:MAG: TipAS antibiotic-recognition domain-containing protein [Oscillospiraceae bacterium]|nr:TipAS antibiotic-recognition domain-containing protein [Oscillospiraceae bacterium]
MIEESEKKYEKEARDKYGDEAVDKSIAKLQNMTKDQHAEIEKLSIELMETLKEALRLKDPKSELAQKVVQLHKKWLCLYWTEYSKEAHVGLANMYVEDERFKKHYDSVGEGATEFLRDAITFELMKD